MKNIKWIVLNKDSLPEEDNWVLFALTVKDYERISINQAEILRWVMETDSQLKYYRGELNVINDK